LVSWATDFKVETKRFQEFRKAVTELLADWPYKHLEWQLYETNKARVSELSMHQPSFGYMVSLNGDLDLISKAENQFENLLEEYKAKLFDLAKKFNAKILVYGDDRSGTFQKPSAP